MPSTVVEIKLQLFVLVYCFAPAWQFVVDAIAFPSVVNSPLSTCFPVATENTRDNLLLKMTFNFQSTVTTFCRLGGQNQSYLIISFRILSNKNYPCWSILTELSKK